MRTLSHRLLLVALCAALAAPGCSGRKLPETVPVTGTILYQGEPVADAEVGFVPRNADDGVHPARGRTDQSGRFSLRTYFGPTDDVAGATPGEFVVTVQKRDIPPDPAELARHFQANPLMVPDSLLPTQYESAEQSPLSATVAKGRNEPFEFELTD